MRYEIKNNDTKQVISKHDNEQDAIKKAEAMDDVHVIAHETSGTYESTQQVWPTLGECYTN